MFALPHENIYTVALCSVILILLTNCTVEMFGPNVMLICYFGRTGLCTSMK